MIMKLMRFGSVLVLVLGMIWTMAVMRGSGTTMAKEIIVADSGNDEHLQAIAFNCNRGEYLIVWSKDVGGGDTDLWARRASLRPSFHWIGAPFVIAESSRPEQAAAVTFNPLADEYLVVYELIFSEADADIKGQRIAGWSGGGDNGPELKGVSIDVAVTVGKETRPDAAYIPATAHYLIAYESDGDIWGRRLAERGQGDNGGELIGEGFAITADTDRQKSEPAVAVSTLQSYFLVTYNYEYRTQDSDLRAQRVQGMTGTGSELISGPIDIAFSANDEHAGAVVYAPHVQAFFVVWQSDSGNNRDLWGAWLDEQVMNGNPTFVGPFAVAADGTAQEFTPAADIDLTSGETAITFSYRDDTMPHVRLGLVWLNPNPLVVPPVSRPLHVFPERPFSFIHPDISMCRGQPDMVLAYTAEVNADQEHDVHLLAASRWASILPMIWR